MITAAQAHKFQQESKLYHIITRQMKFIDTMIEGKANLGHNKYIWLAGEEFTGSEIQHIIDAFRDRGFEVQRNGKGFYTFYW